MPFPSPTRTSASPTRTPSNPHSHFVAAALWERTSGLKSVDRAMEKLTRSYQGNVSLILDVVRQCIVFENLQSLLKAMRIIENDDEIQVVRVKNRMTDKYDGASSGG